MITRVDIEPSLDRFCGISNLSFQCHEVGCMFGWCENIARPQVVRANGLQARGVLGLLSGIVGLLRSCVDYQEVIVSTRSVWFEGIHGCFSLTVFFRLCYHT